MPKKVSRKKKKHSYKRVVDNKMRDYGDIDFDKSVIRVNKKKSKQWTKKHKKAGILDTIAHEEMHRKHPQMSEKVVKKKAEKQVGSMGKREKAKNYSKYIAQRKTQKNRRAG